MARNWITAEITTKATELVANVQDYANIDESHSLAVAYDNTVWVCATNGSHLLREWTLVQRIL